MKKGFTLSEVLITLSIVGVISALTIPSVVKTYHNKIYAVSLKKVYAQINDATRAIVIDEHAGNNGFQRTTAYADNNCTDGQEQGACYFLKKYFRYNNLCTANIGGCAAPSYTTISGTSAGTPFTPCIYTNNGATVCIRKNEGNDMEVFVDVNGPSAPNIIGLDAFGGYISGGNNANLRDYSPNVNDCGTLVNYENVSSVVKYASGCLSKVIKNGWTIE